MRKYRELTASALDVLRNSGTATLRQPTYYDELYDYTIYQVICHLRAVEC